MQPYTKGAGKELGLHSQTVQAIQEEYVTRAGNSRKSNRPGANPAAARASLLGWIPLKASADRYQQGQVTMPASQSPCGIPTAVKYTRGTAASVRMPAVGGI